MNSTAISNSTCQAVVVEVDPGIDDAFALMVLFAAHRLNLIKLLAVVCSNGNMYLDQSCRNTKIIMDLAGVKPDTIPLYHGVNASVVVDYEKDYEYYGKDGLGDVKPPRTPKRREVYQPSKFAENLANTSCQVSYLSLGTLTFLMTFLAQNPQYKFKDIWIMGGNNLNDVNPEWNFLLDPESVHFILKQSFNTPLIIGTFQTCESVLPLMKWRRDDLGKIPADIIKFLNKAETLSSNDTVPWQQYDPVVAVAFTYKESITKLRDAKVNVILGSDGNGIRATLIKGIYPVKFIDGVKLQAYKDALIKSARALK